jgi:glucose-1-phosphate cytidylyltransferase
MTGGRLLRVKDYLKDDETFCFTYGDGVSDVDISETIRFHKEHGKLATLTATYPPGRFGALDISKGCVKSFQEKPKGDGGMINGGFFVLNTKVIGLIDDDSSSWEKKPLEVLAAENQLMAFEHTGFWQPMDTLRDKIYLEELWQTKKAPWKLWE